jgi:chaperone modulatory protein CbpM
MSITSVIIDDDNLLTLADLAHSCNVSPEWVVTRMEAGLLSLQFSHTQPARYSSTALTRVRRLRNIERDFDANPELAALVVDMIEEIERLKRKIYQIDGHAIDV